MEVNKLNEKEILLKVQNLKVNYETSEEIVNAVNNISFELKKGKTLGIVGETGAGKTTTALSIMRLLPKRAARIKGGSIIFEGEDLLSLEESKMRQIRGDKISMIYQDPMTSLNPSITVGSQIAEVIELHQKLTKKEINNKVEEILRLVGIKENRKNDYPNQFSGGMKQRVVIAMALACDPKLLIADEPTTALDVTIQAHVLEMMNELKRTLNTSMLLITHDLGVVVKMCDDVGIIYAGEIIEFGTVESIFSNPLHPYTIGLFGSIPNLSSKVKKLNPVKGTMPDPTNLPKGCKFHPRCPKVMDICSKVEPANIFTKNHNVRCHLYNKDGDIVE